jgi:hypothetical protein
MATSTLARLGNDRGDKSIVLQNGEPEVVVYNTPLTAIRTVELPASADVNDRFYVNRKAGSTGSFNLNVTVKGGTILKSLTAASTWGMFIYSDTGGWQLVAAGSL